MIESTHFSMQARALLALNLAGRMVDDQGPPPFAFV